MDKSELKTEERNGRALKKEQGNAQITGKKGELWRAVTFKEKSKQLL